MDEPIALDRKFLFYFDPAKLSAGNGMRVGISSVKLGCRLLISLYPAWNCAGLLELAMAPLPINSRASATADAICHVQSKQTDPIKFNRFYYWIFHFSFLFLHSTFYYWTFGSIAAGYKAFQELLGKKSHWIPLAHGLDTLEKHGWISVK